MLAVESAITSGHAHIDELVLLVPVVVRDIGLCTGSGYHQFIGAFGQPQAPGLFQKPGKILGAKMIDIGSIAYRVHDVWKVDSVFKVLD